MIDMTRPANIIWTKFSHYYKVCDTSAMRGGTYGFVFNETKPMHYQQPCEFEECVYIGESSGCYYDMQGGSRGKLRSLIHKRMTYHHKPLTTGVGGGSSHKIITEKYGFGETVLDGTLTGKPLWLGILVPREDIPENAIKPWVQMHEREQIFHYTMRYGNSPLGNMDCDSRKQKDSASSIHMSKMGSLEDFWVE